MNGLNSQQPQRVVIQYTRPVTSPHPNFGCFIYVWNCVFQFLNISCAICCIVVGAFLCAAVWYVGVPLIFAGLLLLSVSCWICYYVITGRNVQGRTESQVFYVTGVPSAPAMPYTSQTEFVKKSATTTGTAGHASTTSSQLLTQQRVQIPDNPQSPTAGSCPLNNQLAVYLGEPPPSYDSIVYQSEVNISASATPSPPPVEEMG